MLEQYTAANPGKHFVIFGQWGEKRRMAAGSPRRSSRTALPTACLSFTPDMSREEADRLVLGLNNVAKKITKGQLK